MLLAAAISQAEAANENLLANGDFEAPPSGMKPQPPEWAVLASHEDQLTVTDARARSGAQSIQAHVRDSGPAVRGRRGRRPSRRAATTFLEAL